jgi:phosphoribosylformylglycinamidine cyclo-ligase
MKKTSAYASAGVNIDEKMAGIEAIKKMAKTTVTSDVLSGVGPFGGMFRSPGKDWILVASTDGVGTKLKVASLAGCHTSVGQDIVNHCVNDILVQGATPLFFLDYIASSILTRKLMADVVSGICKACRENNCALLGGETAEMPGVYAEGEYDLVGTLVGQVHRDRVITGRKIKPGDVVIGLPSSGLHTNGYSLARKIIFDKAGLSVRQKLPGTNRSVSDLLLATHLSYLKPITALMKKVSVHGMAHITGGGFYDNIPRVLPDNMDVIIDRASWTLPPLFSFMAKHGKVDRDEMYRVFNMGIGYVVMTAPQDADRTIALLRANNCRALQIGRVCKGSGVTRTIN